MNLCLTFNINTMKIKVFCLLLTAILFLNSCMSLLEIGRGTVKDEVSISSYHSEDKKKALETALGQIRKDFGQESIRRLGDSPDLQIIAVSTGSLTLDLALGVGGVPRGRIVEIYGPESSGKTTVSLHIIAQAQKMGGTAAFIDAEHALDPTYAKALGVDTDNLILSQPDNGEQALEICEALVRSGVKNFVLVDSDVIFWNRFKNL